jgi:hypothetical protein
MGPDMLKNGLRHATNESQSGHPSTLITADNIDKVDGMIQGNKGLLLKPSHRNKHYY